MHLPAAGSLPLPLLMLGIHEPSTSFRSPLKCHGFSEAFHGNIIKIVKITSNAYTYSWSPVSVLFSTRHIIPSNMHWTCFIVLMLLWNFYLPLVNINCTRRGFLLSNLFADESWCLRPYPTLNKRMINKWVCSAFPTGLSIDLRE